MQSRGSRADGRRRVHRSVLIKSPDWRWRRAHDLLVNPDCDPALDDPPTLHALAYLRQRQGDGIPMHVPITRALEIYAADTDLRWKLEAYLVARQTSRVIAPRLKLDRDVVKWYWALFYDARAWMRTVRTTASLIGYYPIQGMPENDLAGLWKRVAARGGRGALDLVIAATTGEGRDRYRPDQLDSAALYAETLRIPLNRVEDLTRLHYRTLIEEAGLPASAYHRKSRRKRGPLRPIRDLTGEQIDPNRP